jgi:hypothetical protein
MPAEKQHQAYLLSPVDGGVHHPVQRSKMSLEGGSVGQDIAQQRNLYQDQVSKAESATRACPDLMGWVGQLPSYISKADTELFLFL